MILPTIVYGLYKPTNISGGGHIVVAAFIILGTYNIYNSL